MLRTDSSILADVSLTASPLAVFKLTGFPANRSSAAF
jgi:hypothetical protein